MLKFFKYLLLTFLISIIIAFLSLFYSFKLISNKIGQPSDYLLKTIYSFNKSNLYKNKDKINFIILGLDKRNDSLEKTNTTDTIMFVSLNLKDYKINTISIPRDLWFYDINAKVNEIYPLSLNESDKYAYIKNKFKILLNQDIDHVLILTTDNLISFTNLIGGVDLVLDQGFIDNQYPNPEYIKNPISSIPKYKTVEFKSGPIHLDSLNITEFVRSRKGGETIASGGTDLARIARQQLLLDALLAKIKSGKFISNDTQLINLYKFWNQDIQKDLSDENILQILNILGKNITNLTFNKITLNIGTNPRNGSIYHPNSFINKQWVFIPSDKEYKSFQQFISNSI